MVTIPFSDAASISAGTSYQNTTGRPITVLYTVQLALDTTSNHREAHAIAEAKSADSGWSTGTLTGDEEVFGVSDSAQVGAQARDVWGQLALVVPSGYYYRLTGITVNGAVAVHSARVIQH